MQAMINIKCHYCDIEFEISKARFKNSKTKLFSCSVECRNNAMKLSWDEVKRSTIKSKFLKTLKKDKIKCNRCNHDKEYNLVIHHIIYVCNGGTNNPENLEILCKNCHGTEHFDNGQDHGKIIKNGKAKKTFA